MKKIIMVAGAILAFVLPLLGQSGPPPLRLVQTIPLSVDGRMDHLYADVKGMRLFVAALANNTVEVIDLRAGKVIKSIAGPQKPQGVWYVSPLNKLFVASGNDGMCRVYDGKTLDLIESIKLDMHERTNTSEIFGPRPTLEEYWWMIRAAESTSQFQRPVRLPLSTRRAMKSSRLGRPRKRSERCR